MSASQTPEPGTNTGLKAPSSPNLSSLVQRLETQSEDERRQIETAWKASLQKLNSDLQHIAADVLTSTEADIKAQLTEPVRKIRGTMSGVRKSLDDLSQTLQEAGTQTNSVRTKIQQTVWISAGAILAAALILVAGMSWYVTTLTKAVWELRQAKTQITEELANLPTPPIEVSGKPGKWVRIDDQEIVSLTNRSGRWARAQ